MERSELQGQAPGETAEEIVPQFQEAETRFTKTLKEGEALNAVQSAFAQVKAEMDGQTLTPWLQELQRLLATLTEGRYRGLELENEEALRQDGLKVPGPLLSGGAKVSFGLAVRLSMASHFLQNLGGFLVMDDPVVDLDDVGRQHCRHPGNPGVCQGETGHRPHLQAGPRRAPGRAQHRSTEGGMYIKV